MDSLIRATPGSAGLDLNSTIAVTLTPDIAQQAIPTGIWGTVPPGTLGLILGRSGNTLKGLTVLPGVIDSDYEGEIKVILECNHVMQVTPGQRIAQILLLPYVQQCEAINRKRGMQGFGSSDIYWIHEISKTRPGINLRIEGKHLPLTHTRPPPAHRASLALSANCSRAKTRIPQRPLALRRQTWHHRPNEKG